MSEIRVGMSFYPRGREEVRWVFMPQVPQRGDTLHYSLTDDPDDSRSWTVNHVAWVRKSEKWDEWHAEIGLS